LQGEVGGVTGDEVGAARAAPSVPTREASSPYSTGGGGVTLERRVAARYLGLLLTGGGADELGEGRTVTRVAFQQAPAVAVDDLVVHAAREGDAEPSLELAIGVRRAPNLVRSDEDAQKLLVEYVRALLMPPDERERRLALVVAGEQTHAGQVAELADLAARQADSESFFALLGEEGKSRKQLTDRLDHVTDLVRSALKTLGVDADDQATQRHTWELLSHLSVLMTRLESPDESDWSATRNELMSVARRGELAGAGVLLTRLEGLAATYAPSAATVNLKLLRREVHSLLEPGVRRHQRAWQVLDQLDKQARMAVRGTIGTGADALQLDRAATAATVVEAAATSRGVLAGGESGVGKSVLVLGALRAAVEADPDQHQVLNLNLRHLPATPFELASGLGAPLADVLGELSAPRRILVVDGADAAGDDRRDVLVQLVRAASEADVRVVAIASNETAAPLRDLLGEQLGTDGITDVSVPVLTDAEINEVVAGFPQLERLASTPRSRELLRRLVVVDLLVRSGVSEVPLSDLDAMQQVWEGLVRRSGRGSAHAREHALLELARLALRKEDEVDVAGRLDGTAVDGLRSDGLLAAPRESPWQVLPDFGHDEVRRYAVARVLLSHADPAGELLAAGAPRWTLSAARLACATLLSSPARDKDPVEGRFGRLQAAFVALAEAGHGERWRDVPSEALLVLSDPSPVLADAWPALRAGNAEELHRLLRLVKQRHRRSDGTLDVIVVEPIIAKLLEEGTPWEIGEDVRDVLTSWLQSLAMRRAPAGNALREQMRERLVAVCAEAERREAEARAAAGERSSQSAEELAVEQGLLERGGPIMRAIGGGRVGRRRRLDIPRELRDETLLELLALLGADLGEEGERLLRRVATEAPNRLEPAVESLGAGVALAQYRRGLLADLTEAYYLNDRDDGSFGWHEDGIRRHGHLGVGVPLSAWYRGPFTALFQSDFLAGVRVLNRLLNHAADTRVRTLAGLGDPFGRPAEGAVEAMALELSVTGKPRRYAGDSHVWFWYRGTGVGPYPCMSALQALERVCDQFLAAQIPLERIVALMLDGCENLAMLGLVVGVLVRHLERAGALLDPFLAEPDVWQLEFARVVSESGGLAANSEGLANAERRGWSFREAAMWMVVNADEERAERLQKIGEQLVANAENAEPDRTADGADDGATSPSRVTLARNWASALDYRQYRTRTEGDSTVVEVVPPDDVLTELGPGNEDLRRGHEVVSLSMRYAVRSLGASAATAQPDGEQMAADLAVGIDLFENPPQGAAVGIWDAVAAVSAAALRAHLLDGVGLDADAIAFAVATVFAVAEGADPPDQFEFEGSYFERGSDRAAARALPLLLLPAAASVVDGARVASAGHRLAHAVADEVRLHLARGLDAVWTTPCEGSPCHHELALDLAIETMRDCMFGGWDHDSGRRHIERVDDPLPESLSAVPGDNLYVARLDAAIRAVGRAATVETCVRERARDLLLDLVGAQRRGLVAHEENYDDRGSSALVAARALLGLAATGDDQPLFDHINGLADNATQMGSFLRALAAAAEETQSAAEAAQQIWPEVIGRVLELDRAGHSPFGDRYFGRMSLASLAPMPTADIAFLYRELEGEPIAWTDVEGWKDAIDAWLATATGEAQCVDSLIGLLRTAPESVQARLGVPWVSALVLPDVEAVVRRSFFIDTWLKEIRSAASEAGVVDVWQRLVDALVVAGDTQLAPYSD
jgi:hypothetical protein